MLSESLMQSHSSLCPEELCDKPERSTYLAFLRNFSVLPFFLFADSFIQFHYIFLHVWDSDCALLQVLTHDLKIKKILLGRYQVFILIPFEKNVRENQKVKDSGIL